MLMTHESNDEIVLYGSTTCNGCKQVIIYFSQRAMGYRYVNVQTEEGMEEFRKLGVTSIPVVTFKGEMVVGYNKPLLDRLFGETNE